MILWVDIIQKRSEFGESNILLLELVPFREK